jgi:hypothetical protein
MFFRLAHARTTLAEAPRRWGKNVAPILLFKNEGAARALVCGGVTRSEKAFVSQCVPDERLSPF